MHYYWTDLINSQSGCDHSSFHWLAFTFRLVQALLDRRRLLPQGDQVPWLQFPCHVRPCLWWRRERKRTELTKNEDEGEDINPILLDEALLWFRFDDLTLGRKGWRRAQLRPRVAFDQIPDHRHARHLSPQRTNQNAGPGSGWSKGEGVDMTNEVKDAQRRESRPLDVDRSVRECDWRDYTSLGLGRKRTAAIRRNRRKEVVYSGRFTIGSQMKENRVRRSGGQVTLSDPEGKWINSRSRRVI